MIRSNECVISRQWHQRPFLQLTVDWLVYRQPGLYLLSPRYFPEYYYELNFGASATGPRLTVLMVDTVLLCGNSDDFADAQPQGPANEAAADRQLRWLRRRMEASRADFLLVAGHYPVWSVAEHGPTDCLLEKLRPLLVKHRATAYLSGHDHNLQVWVAEATLPLLNVLGGIPEIVTSHGLVWNPVHVSADCGQ